MAGSREYQTPIQKDYQLLSYLGRVNINLFEKYLITALFVPMVPASLPRIIVGVFSLCFYRLAFGTGRIHEEFEMAEPIEASFELWYHW